MRKWSLIFFAALAILMAGCERIVETGNPVGEEPWMYDQTLPVPVKFGVSGTDTRVSIEDASQIDGNIFGIFAFDKASSDLTARDELMLRNAPAVGVYSDGKASLRLSKTVYYPQFSEREYTFYSYYARQRASVVYEQTATQTLVTIPVSNEHDVLWAMSEAEGGYNASFLREGNELPSFTYSHATACLSFNASVKSVVPGIQVSLESLALIAPASATLCVVDLLDTDKQGTFVWKGNDVERLAHARYGGDSGNLHVVLDTEPQDEPVCKDMFIVPGSVSQKVKAVFRTQSYGVDGILGTGDDPKPQLSTVEVVLTPGDSGETFKAGWRYAYNIRMHSPQEVSLEFNGAYAGDDGNDGQISVEDFTPAFQ